MDRSVEPVHMVRRALLLCLLFAAFFLQAWGGEPLQADSLGTLTSSADWAELWQELSLADDDDATAADNEVLEQLADLASHPININRATRSDLEQLPFLTAQQVADICEYLDRHRLMRSLAELRLIGSLDVPQLQLLPHFVTLGQPWPESGSEGSAHSANGDYSARGGG